MTPAIAARGLSAGYHGVPVIRDVDLEVHPGEIVLLAGPNGAGKTTTVMTLAGALRPLAGQTEIDGEATRVPLFRRVRGGVGVVTEQRSVFGRLTLADNLRLGRGPSELALRYFPELEKRLRVRAGLLSGGEQQMLALARVLAARPEVILADEMSMGLAPSIVARLLGALRSAADAGTAVLLVEQHVHLGLAVADRACFLRRGRVELQGDAQTIRHDENQIEQIYL